VDTTVTADAPTYAVLRAGGTRHHVAFNPTDRRTRVRFSDGATVELGPFEQKLVSAPVAAATAARSRGARRVPRRSPFAGDRDPVRVPESMNCTGALRCLPWRRPWVAPAATAGDAPAGWQLVWSDEFDGPAGSPPDASRWSFEVGGHGWGNNEEQFYTDRNVALDGAGAWSSPRAGKPWAPGPTPRAASSPGASSRPTTDGSRRG
jgi:hypothetical protein